mgnify:CR=1 FL=1
MKQNLKIAVAGTGYVGLSISVLLSQQHKVYAVDIIPEKVDLINQKKSPIVDKEIEEYLATKDLNFRATTDKYDAYKNADYVINAGDDMKHYAYVLYEALREFDKHNIEVIYAQFEDERGIGVAVKNRIFKSAGYKIINV